LLQESKKLIDDTLNIYPHKKVHIDIDPNAKPVHFMPHPGPRIHLKTFKKEDNRVRWISNSRQLNRVTRRKQYPLLIITDILRKYSGYKFFAKLDVSLQCYTFELDNKSQDSSCTSITPFGKYKYLRLLTGLKYSPDIAQAIMEMYCQKIDEEFI
jgi:hypothetical protein